MEARVGWRGVEQIGLGFRELLLRKARQFARRAGIMRSVQINVGPRVQLLEPSRPHRCRNAFPDRIRRNAETLSLQHACSCYPREHVLQLKPSRNLPTTFHRPPSTIPPAPP